MPSARSVYFSALAAAALCMFAASSASAQTLPASRSVPLAGVPAAGTAARYDPAVGTVMAGDPGIGSRGQAAIYVARRGWHIDIGFAAGELRAPWNSASAKLPGARYVFFGFGDRRYLMAKHGHIPAMIEALWPGKGLILATGLSASPVEAFGIPHVVELRISPEQSSAAQDFIWRSLTKTPSPDADRIDVVERGPYEGSLYFNAGAKYSAIHTCNTWAAEVLSNAGLPVRTSGVVFAGQVWSRVGRLAAAE